MTPETLRIDRTFKGVGRIARATGTTNPAIQRKLSRMLTALYDDGRLDILRAIRDRVLPMLQVYDAYQRRALHELPVANTLPLVAVAMTEWIESLTIPTDCSAKHAESLETSRRYFEKADPKATIADLPRVVEGLRDTLGKQHPRSFNLAKSAAQSFVRAKLKRNHDVYRALVAIEPRPEPNDTKRSPLTPDQMRNFFPKPETDWLDAIAWGMATTGMHAKEYWGRWSVLADRIHVGGTKREGRNRDVPLVRVPTAPKFNRRKFEDDLRERTRSIVVYDLRRTFANWMESAGIPRTRRKLYMGHGATDVTDLYEWHEVAAFLADDAAKLRKFAQLPTIPHTMRLEKSEGA